MESRMRWVPSLEITQVFSCPYCTEHASLLVEPTIEGEQRFVQDCAVWP